VPITPTVFPNRSNVKRPSSAKLLSRVLVGAVELAVERQDHADGELGHRMRRVGRHADRRQAQGVRGREVDIVETGAAQRDQPGPTRRQHLQHGRVADIVDEQAHGREPGGKRRRLLAQPRFAIVQRVPE
jgi:hypothetical protein